MAGGQEVVFDLGAVRNRIVDHVMLYPYEVLDHPGQAWDHPGSQAKALVGLLKQFGIVDELLIYRSKRMGDAYVAIDGHLRKNLDPRRQWPCTVLDLTDEEADGVLLTFDPVGQMKQANAAALDALLSAVETTDVAVQSMLTDLAEKAGLYIDRPDDDRDAVIEPDRGAELREKWQVEPGQIWALGPHRLLVGDCTDVANLERLFGGDRCDLVVTSPPYAVGKEYELDVSWAEHLALLNGLADRCLERVVEGGFIFINFAELHSMKSAHQLTGSNRPCSYPISLDYWRIFHLERGCDLYAMRMWRKPFNKLSTPFFAFGTSRAHQQEWEHLWTWRTPGGDKDQVYDLETSLRAVWDTSAEQSDKPLTEHVAAFPPGIPRRAMLAHSAEGAVVWEPFCGSGTSIVVAEQLRRICYACELEPSYVAVTLERFARAFDVAPVLEESA